MSDITFDHETISIGEPRDKAYQCDTGCRIYITSWTKNDRRTAHNFLLNVLNESLKNIMTFTPTTDLDYDSSAQKG